MIELLPAGVGASDMMMLEDSIMFAANSQIPHVLKNLVLMGVCVVYFLLGKKLCVIASRGLAEANSGT